MALILKHQTPEQLVARIREMYRNGQRTQLLAIARFILARIQTGDITDAQCRTAFGLNASQWTNVKTRMQNFINADNTLLSAVGE